MKATRTCSVPGCEGKHEARGYCAKHYQRLLNNGTVERRTVGDRLRAKLVERPNGCIEWTGKVTAWGYGLIGVGYKQVGTHRLAWEMEHGPIPEGMFVLHRCDNPPCCNVGHLFLGTPADNTADMMRKGRGRAGGGIGNQNKTHCVHGHPFDAANTYVLNGRRYCRACSRVRRRACDRKRRSPDDLAVRGDCCVPG